MKITEQKNNLEVTVPKMMCEKEFNPPAPPPLLSKPHVYMYVGSKGSGKTSLAISLLTSKKKNRAYYRNQHNVLLSIPANSLHSISNKLITDHDKIYNDFDLEFLDEVEETASEGSYQDEFTMALIDDSGVKLKDKFLAKQLTSLVHRHRHLLLSIHLLVQSMMDVPLSIRKNVDGIFFFKPVNSKQSTAFIEEYLGDLTKEEVQELFNYVFDKKGNFLFVKTSTLPFEYYKNFNKLEFK
tara:strand:+ start:2381 stop:3100 length:720 start_codon:yes stop_codon:yes gene_type:complete